MLRRLSHRMASCSTGVQQQLLAGAGSTVLGSTCSFEREQYTLWQGRRWATKKQGGSTKNKKDSQPKYLGTKMSDGQIAFPGQMLVKQRGTKFHPGHNVGMGTDFTLFAKSVGLVSFRHGSVLLPGRAPSAAKQRCYIDVLPLNNDWSEGYPAKVAQMIARRNEIRQQSLGLAAKYGKR
eukprot:GHRQ01009300.1.p1 GENE.GHRQ01009300.1~~GHRQ01009300.1.p1  ORF type:complete len:194 (+),score=27.94 GHRQ01009300.1:46-582(+)